MKKALSLTLVLLLMITLFAGCSIFGGKETIAPAGSSTSAAESVPAVESVPASESVPAGPAWVLLYENTKQREDSVSGMYTDTYSWKKDEERNLMIHTHVKVADGNPYQKTVMDLTCTLPPETGAPGSKIKLDIAAVLAEMDIAKYYFGDSCSVQYAGPGKDLGIAGHYFWNILDEGSENASHKNAPDAGVGGDNVNQGDSCTVFWSFPEFPQPGDKFAFYFMSFGVETEWCYEYRN